MTQPAPQIGDAIIDIGIPQRWPATLEFEQAILPISHEFTDMWRPDQFRNWYQILDTKHNRRELTAIILQFPDIVTRHGVNRVDPDFFELESGTAA